MVQEYEHVPVHQTLMQVLGIPHARISAMPNHFDFSIPGRRVMIIGPMGSGKTEYSLRILKDARVLKQKAAMIAEKTLSGSADRRNVAFVRFSLDSKRFLHSKRGELVFRGGREQLDSALFTASDSFSLERHISEHPEIGTWIIDEASFYDERLAYVVLDASHKRGLVFILPTLALNFRNVAFNSTALLLLEHASDIFLLSAYCEHTQCMNNAHATYRYYTIDGAECPAPFFDPLIIIGGDRQKRDNIEPDYIARCTAHHYLPAKEYTYLVLNPLGMRAAAGDMQELYEELHKVKNGISSSSLAHSLSKQSGKDIAPEIVLRLPCMAERMLLYLFVEQNHLTREQFIELCTRLDLNIDYLKLRLGDNTANSSFL